jgi:hypothetical protein
VEYARRGVLDEALDSLSRAASLPLVLFGVKDTDQISPDLVQRLGELPGYLFHTVDAMAPGGRAVDPNLVNPLTGRMMTGSSSGGCQNILLGINDLALATDGGGSVLAPALATGLYSIMAKGLGLKGRRPRVSTDNIEFVPGIGLISHSYEICAQAVSHLTGVEAGAISPPLVVRPREPGLAPLLEAVLAALGPVPVVEPPVACDRPGLIAFVQEQFARSSLVLSFEGPVDLHGYGDSVLGSWGEGGRAMQGRGGKDLLKVANMVDATALSIPALELACGVLVLAAPGREAGGAALALGAKLAAALPRPRLYEEYFGRAGSRPAPGYI